MDRLLMVAAVLAYGLAQLLLGEKLLVGGGLGWDGTVYGGIASDLPGFLSSHGLDAYRAQRFLPGTLIYAVTSLLGMKLGTPAIVRAYDLLNVLLLAGTAWFYAATADVLGLKRGARWFGFFCLFLNFGVARQMPHVPVSTDVPALFLSMLSAYAYLADRRRLLLGVTFVGAFCWPTVIFFNTLLILFPRGESVWLTRSPSGIRKSLLKATTLLALSCVLVVLAASILAYHKGDWEAFRLAGVEQLDRDLLPFSLAIQLSYVFAGMCLFIPLLLKVDLRKCGKALRTRAPALVATLAAIFVIRWQLVTLFPPASPFGRGLVQFAGLSLLLSLLKPGIFLVSHAVYFGPAMVLIAVFARKFLDAAARLGLGPVLSVFLIFILSLNSETREFTFGFPLLVMLLAVAVAKHRELPGLTAWVVVAGFASSKIWAGLNDGTVGFLPTEEPLQRVFMHNGPWMTWPSYSSQLVFVILSGIALAMAIRSKAAA